ncbi:MAG: beta-lactamase family protein [Clostridia bacterium]|nr:beta-lactamase family protein [Clostridia bacterium]
MQQINRQLLKSNIEKIAQFDLAENNVFGASYIVRQVGEVVYKNHFGITDIVSNIAVTDDTMFRLASMTKPVTAMAVLMLIDRGILSLFDPVKKYLPKFENIHIISADGADLGETKTDVTILHLLTHTSGFGSIKACKMTSEDKKTIHNTVDCFIGAGLDFEPFTQQAYSAFAAFDVLGAIIEKLTGEDYEEFLQREIFLPCNMKDTTFMPSDSQWKRMITMHNKSEGKSCVGKTEENCVFEDFPCSHKLAGAGLASTLTDYSRFAEMLLNKGKTNKTQIVSEETFNLLCVPHVPSDIMPGNQRWGLSVRVITDDTYGTLPVGAYGWSGAYGSHFWIDPKNKITAVFMKNSGFDGGAGNKSACRFEKAVHDALMD